jgi:hypothetical protein
VGSRTGRRARRQRETEGEPFITRRQAWVAAALTAALLMLIFTKLRVPQPRPDEPRLAQDASLRLIGGGAQPENCLVERGSNRAIGPVYAVLGRDGRPVMYRVTPYVRGRARHPPLSVGFPQDVVIESVRVVPCARLGARRYYDADLRKRGAGA